MRKIALLLITMLLISCKSKKDEVSLSLANERLEYNFSYDSIYTAYYTKSPNIKYLKYLDENQKAKCTNVVKMRIENKTDKKLLFLIKNKRIDKIVGIKINIYENDKLIEYPNEVTIDPYFSDPKEKQKFSNFVDYEGYLLNNSTEDDLRLGIHPADYLSRDYLEQSLVLDPDEFYTLNSLITLPILRENTLYDFKEPVYYHFKKGEDYFFSITYHIDKKELLKQLTKEQLEELKSNNIEIFDGTIETKRIPIINN